MKMKKEQTTTVTCFFILLAVSMVSCDCPVDKTRNIGYCSYRIVCFETINDVKLNRECRGSTNYDLKIEVSLLNASNTLHVTADEEFLTMVTSLEVYANWSETKLSFLETMYSLRYLYLTKCDIKIIRDSPFRNLMYLEILDLSRNSISEIGELFQFNTRPLKMYKLSLAHNLIKEVPGDTFKDLTTLIELDLSYNFITDLIEEPFFTLTHLQTLKLNNNRVQDLNGAMNNLTDLKHLYLANNDIHFIDMRSLKTINHLQTFDISNNKIEDFEPILLLRHWDHFKINSFCKIIISGNLIYLLPNSTLRLYESLNIKPKRNILEQPTIELDLSKNAISHIEYNAFQSVGQIVSLDLSKNKMLTFDVDAEDVKYVRYLNLSYNSLTELTYKSFALMQNLQNLDLSHNDVYYFPDQSLSNSNKLKYINVSDNGISELQSLQITFHYEGGVLDLSNNGLSFLSIPANEATGLRQLILKSNNITDPFLIKLTDQWNLTHLDMSNNFIEELDQSSLQLPITLSYLDLSFNKIKIIQPSTFTKLSHLKVLRLSHNLLNTIEFGVFRGLASLLHLDLSYNRIEKLDSKVFMDLKLLTLLSLRYNGLTYLDHNSWLGHDYNNLTVYLDGNELPCEWMASVFNDFINGYSKMEPAVFNQFFTGHSYNGVPCERSSVENQRTYPQYVIDERLLIVTQKILKVVQEQNDFLRKSFWKFIVHENREATENTSF